jgi:pSer/pThr/pTyr-binding forkhead associated (FHA) protein
VDGRGWTLDLDGRPEAHPSEDLTVFCTRCGHPNRDDARFCAECGAPLQDDATLTLTPVEPEDEAHDEFPFPHDELEPGQALLLVKRGPNAGSTFLLHDAEVSVGRGTDSGVFLDDITVSRAHAVFERRVDDGWFVRDVGSLNGTYVNGEQVDQTKLASSDEVQIGKFKLTFFAAGE